MVVVFDVLEDIWENDVFVEHRLALWFRETSNRGRPPFLSYPWVDIVQIHSAESK